ncbi:uncharacterized protein LOC111634623 [Centruroides sculpturatus]|uniref:uncharacterized protein LOC111634623 n=1 Tax=Centruroides sculpturatus TaxID=218467 RepID=UPI000C6CAA93|nr:uncharacterized protein LOC111634623 [Centruroides sculpturatus]
MSSSKEISILSTKISSMKPFNAIIEEVRDSLSTPEELQRFHLVTRKDPHNIESSFQLSSNSVKHPNDSISVDLEAAVIKLVDDSDTTDFGQYLKENYMKTAKYWAYCYRLHCGLNTDMHVENMHKCIKHIYFQGKRLKHLDKAIHALMTFLRDKMYDKIIVMHKGKVTSKLSDLRKRHKISLSLCKDLLIKEDNTWKIPSSNGSDICTVAMIKENCECQIVCNKCKSCIHMYTCICIDSAIKFNMCKHIHLVCQLRAESVSKHCEGQQGELLI